MESKIIMTPETVPAKIGVLENNANFLMYKCIMRDKPAEELSLFQMHEDQPTWDVGSMMSGLSRLSELSAEGEILHQVYDPETCEAEIDKADVCIWHMKGKKQKDDKPFIVCIAGGAYTCVCSMVEAFPTAARFNELGYTVFVLTYRVNQDPLLPKPLEDLAMALKHILTNKDKYGLSSEEYIVNGYSAGGNLTTLWGTESKGYGYYGLPKPKAILPIYPCISSEYLFEEGAEWFLTMMHGKGYDNNRIVEYDIPNILTKDYPPAYIVHAKDDMVVSAINSVKLKELLEHRDIPVELELVAKGGHGFGDGSGTDAHGWPERAIEFIENLQ